MIRETAIDLLSVKNRKLADLIMDSKVQASIPVMERLSQLSEAELELIFEAARNYGCVCRIFYNKENSGVPGENVMIKAAHKPSSRRVYPLMPIKRVPVFDPDAELSSLALTIPSWKESIKRKCLATDYSAASAKAKNNLVSELALLSELCVSIIEEINSNDKHTE